MSDEFFGDRRRALEDSFFAQVNQRLMEEMRAKLKLQDNYKALSEVSGVSDPKLLEQMAEVGIGPETFAALSLIPLIEVAWADGSINPKERQAVMEASHGHGLEAGTAAQELLSSWLEKRPPEEVLKTWREYVSALSQSLEPAARESLKHDLLGRARKVAEAAGSILGLGPKVSAAERNKLHELEAAFH